MGEEDAGCCGGGSDKLPFAICQAWASSHPPPAAHHCSVAKMSTAGARGLRATYHRVLDKVELMLPEKLRPLYNHPAGNGPRTAPPALPPSP